MTGWRVRVRNPNKWRGSDIRRAGAIEHPCLQHRCGIASGTTGTGRLATETGLPVARRRQVLETVDMAGSATERSTNSLCDLLALRVGNGIGIRRLLILPVG